jgi:DNA-binding NtrC family response regulator
MLNGGTGTAILVVEDDALILLDLETALVDAGFEVVTAASAAAALNQFGSGHIKALITNIRLEMVQMAGTSHDTVVRFQPISR